MGKDLAGGKVSEEAGGDSSGGADPAVAADVLNAGRHTSAGLSQEMPAAAVRFHSHCFHA